MIVLDYMLGMKCLGDKYIHPKCKIFFQSIFNNMIFDNITMTKIARHRERLKRRFCCNLPFYLDNREYTKVILFQYLHE